MQLPSNIQVIPNYKAINLIITRVFNYVYFMGVTANYD